MPAAIGNVYISKYLYIMFKYFYTFFIFNFLNPYLKPTKSAFPCYFHLQLRKMLKKKESSLDISFITR